MQDHRPRYLSDDELLQWILKQGVPAGNCLDWPRAKSGSLGYGYIKYKGKQWRLPRLVWKLIHGSIPDGMNVLHSCDRPICFLPSHLHLGTISDNTLEAFERKRRFSPNPYYVK